MSPRSTFVNIWASKVRTFVSNTKSTIESSLTKTPKTRHGVFAGGKIRAWTGIWRAIVYIYTFVSSQLKSFNAIARITASRVRANRILATDVKGTLIFVEAFKAVTGVKSSTRFVHIRSDITNDATALERRRDIVAG